MRLANPKLRERFRSSRGSLFPYYAGFSRDFVWSCLLRLSPPSGAAILDPWNGSGTTTSVAASCPGLRVFGSDLNPAMVVVAKAQLLGQDVLASRRSLARHIAASVLPNQVASTEPLLTWVKPRTASLYRSLEQTISQTLIPHELRDFTHPYAISELSALASFYYLALFRSVRKSLSPFLCSNPTWIRTPKPNDRVSSSPKEIVDSFLEEASVLCGLSPFTIFPPDEPDGANVDIAIDDSRFLSIESSTIDIVIGSPPYCTRIDYAMTTRPELAILGIGEGCGFNSLRKRLTGTVFDTER